MIETSIFYGIISIHKCKGSSSLIQKHTTLTHSSCGKVRVESIYVNAY